MQDEMEAADTREYVYRWMGFRCHRCRRNLPCTWDNYVSYIKLVPFDNISTFSTHFSNVGSLCFQLT